MFFMLKIEFYPQGRFYETVTCGNLFIPLISSARLQEYYEDTPHRKKDGSNRITELA